MKQIQTLGGLAVFDGNRPLGGSAQQPRRLAILAVLARAGAHGVNRDRLAALFWGDAEEERARRNLNQALYALRQDLGAEDAILGTRDLRLNSELVEIDVLAFEAARASGRLEEAARLYAGPFLGDFHLPGVREFARWAEEERARLEADYRALLQAVAAAASQRGDRGTALLWWRRLAALDPADAQVAQGLMRALTAAGDIPGAVRHAEIFAAVREQELELPPDPAVAALAEQIRRGSSVQPEPSMELHPVPALPAARLPLEPPPPAPPAVPRPRRWIAGGLLVLGLVALARGVDQWLSASRDELRPSVVAVAPFDVFDTDLDLWREGLVDLLSRNLDGAGPLRTVPPTIVVRRWRGRADPASARRLGRRTGAGLALYGSLLRAGADSVRLRATLLDVARDRVLGEYEAAEAEQRIDRLTDSLTIRLLEGLGRTQPVGAVRRSGLGTTRLPALKAFLQGEQHFRRSEWDSALSWYERAIALDSAFVPALRRASNARAWRHALEPDAERYAYRAGANNHGLPTRDSLLVLAESLLESVSQAGPVGVAADADWLPRVERLFTTLSAAASSYPDDPETWFLLGDAHNHFAPYVGRSLQLQLEAFDRAIALDSAFAPSYLHPIQNAGVYGRDAVRRYLRPYLALAPNDDYAQGARLVAMLLDSIPPADHLEALCRDVPDLALFYAAATLDRLADSAELGVTLFRSISGRRGITLPLLDSNFVRFQLARALMSRGHIRQAGAYLNGQEDWLGYGEAALLGAVPSPRAAAVFDARLSGPASHLLVGAYPWWAARRDSMSLRRAAKHADSLSRRATDETDRGRARYAAASAAAYLALVQEDRDGALSRFFALREGLCPACYLDRWTLVRLLVEGGRYEEAWPRLQAGNPTSTLHTHPTEVLWMLLRGKAAERLGHRQDALESYAWVAGMWREADPELQPYLRQAREGVVRLGGVSQRKP